MTLEQRVEALENQMALLRNGHFALKDGEVFINDAMIEGGEIKTAQIRTVAYDASMTTCIHIENFRVFD